MMKERVFSATIILLVLASILLLSYFEQYIFDAFWVVVIYATSCELVKLANKRCLAFNKYIVYAFPVLFFAGLVLSIKLDFAFYQFIVLQLMIFVGLALITFIWTVIFNRDETKQIENVKEQKLFVLNKIVNTMNIIIYPAFCLSIFLIFNHIADLGLVNMVAGINSWLIGLFAIVLVFAVSMLTDTFAMLTGKLLKGPKLCPTISAHKTVSGFFGGVAFGILGAILVYMIFNSIGAIENIFVENNVNIWFVMIYGLLGALATMAGDLIASKMKRQAFVKDFGRVFPGHGGFMDRLNGVALNCVIALLFFVFVF